MSSALWAPDHLLSSDDWNALDREPYLHYELSDGVLVMTPARHRAINMWSNEWLTHWRINCPARWCR